MVYLLIDHMAKGNYRCSVSICNLPCRVGDMRYTSTGWYFGYLSGSAPSAFLFPSWKEFSLFSPGWPGSHHVDQAYAECWNEDVPQPVWSSTMWFLFAMDHITILCNQNLSKWSLLSGGYNSLRLIILVTSRLIYMWEGKRRKTWWQQKLKLEELAETPGMTQAMPTSVFMSFLLPK